MPGRTHLWHLNRSCDQHSLTITDSFSAPGVPLTHSSWETSSSIHTEAWSYEQIIQGFQCTWSKHYWGCFNIHNQVTLDVSSPCLMYWICSSSCQRDYGFSSEYGNPLHIKKHLLLFCRPEKTLHTQITTVSIFCSISMYLFFLKISKRYPISQCQRNKEKRHFCIHFFKSYFITNFWWVLFNIFEKIQTTNKQQQTQARTNENGWHNENHMIFILILHPFSPRIFLKHKSFNLAL